MSLDAVRRFFERRVRGGAAPEDGDAGQEAPAPRHGVELAACALLLELAHADDEFSEPEREHLHEVLSRHFAVAPDAIEELIALAEEERRRAVDLYQFTSLITEQFDDGQRMLLAEIMWRIVLADGELSKHEHYLLRKLSNLLDLRPGYLAEARERARR